MKHITLYFQVHQPTRLRSYRFFDIGESHYYYDDYLNKKIIQNLANECYLPANEVIYELIKKFGAAFKVSYSITGIAIEQFQKYAPEVIKSFAKLAKTGCVEFLGETYSHSLTSLQHPDEFIKQVKKHYDLMQELFDYSPVTFRNTELIYSNSIAEQVLDMGFKVMLTEGTRQTLGWKSPNYLYCSASNESLKLLLRNYQLSDDITYRFSQQDWNEYPITADKFFEWINGIDEKQEVVNIFMDYETFGEHQKAETGIFEFLKAMPEPFIRSQKWNFKTPSEIIEELKPVAKIDSFYPISWADEERDITAWLGNDMQNDAFINLYKVKEVMAYCKDEELLADWNHLQSSDNFYYMSTKWFSDSIVLHYSNPYNSPYDAFLNYMNVLTDFVLRVKEYEKNNPKPRGKTAKIKLPIVTVKTKEKPAVEKKTTERKPVKKVVKTVAKTVKAKAETKTTKAKKTK